MQQQAQGIKHMLEQLGWQKTTRAVGYLCSFQLNQSDLIWHCNLRWLNRHRHQGVTADDTIRYRTTEGLRIQFKRSSDTNSKLLFTTISSVGWLRWLIDKGLKFRGFKKYPDLIGALSTYYQDIGFIRRLFGDEAFIQSAEPLNESAHLLRWELSLMLGEVIYNLTFNHRLELTGEVFNELFNDCQKNATLCLANTTLNTEDKR